MHPPANKSVDINYNISTQLQNNFSPPHNDDQQQAPYNPWDQPQQNPISMRPGTGSNYYEEINKPVSIAVRLSFEFKPSALFITPKKDSCRLCFSNS